MPLAAKDYEQSTCYLISIHLLEHYLSNSNIDTYYSVMICSCFVAAAVYHSHNHKNLSTVIELLILSPMQHQLYRRILCLVLSVAAYKCIFNIEL